MKTQLEPISEKLQETITQFTGGKKDVLFFDIESTGLSPKGAFVYLIGAAACEGGSWVLRQWFAENMAEEEAILTAFLTYAQGFDRLAHFNGTTFDVPFLQARCKKFSLSCSLAKMEQLDLYRQISPYKNVLKLPNCKQKTLEEYLGLFREDPFSGGQLIELYKVYRQQADPRLLSVLLLHNADDIRGMLSILPMLSYPPLFTGQLSGTQAHMELSTDYAGNAQKELLISVRLPRPLPVPLAIHANGCFFSGKASDGLLKVPVYCGELKYFYPDYKNYSYLPAEDKAIHKSVAIYVDKSHRVPATPDTCYTRQSGDFIPLPAALSEGKKATDAPPAGSSSDAPFSPVFRKKAKEKEGFFLPDEAFLHDGERLSLYAGAILSQMR